MKNTQNKAAPGATGTAFSDTNTQAHSTKPKLTPREIRALMCLIRRPHYREELDKNAGCSNGPELVGQLRRKGLAIKCKRVTKLDRDGRECRPGLYSLSADAALMAKEWLGGDA